jgi:demethylmacrocin O-methyltransferase
MTTLCELAEKHMTDKGPRFHGYTKYYYENITKYMDPATVKKVGEIGIGFFECMCHVSDDYKPGASLRMWEEFFPAATIHGFDINESTLFESGRITCSKMDQGSEESIKQVLQASGPEFDIIIDDGSHIIHHQILTKNVASKYVKPGGLLIIEDIREAYLEYWFEDPPEGFEKVAISDGNPLDCFVIYRRMV